MRHPYPVPRSLPIAAHPFRDRRLTRWHNRIKVKALRQQRKEVSLIPVRLCSAIVLALLPLLAACDDDDDDFANRVAVVLYPGETVPVVLEIEVDDAEAADFVLDCGFVSICGIDGFNLEATVEFAGVSGEEECAARIAVTAFPDAVPGWYEICVRFFYTYVDFFGRLFQDDTRGYIEVTVAEEPLPALTPMPTATPIPPG
jgi:hypothetical protein